MARDAIRLYIKILIKNGVFSPCGRRAYGKWPTQRQMPKQPSLTAKIVIKILEKKGSVLKRISRRHCGPFSHRNEERAVVPCHV
jgi:predicted RNA binding protein YcfA (HicA-like mRNA interferase family)